MKSNSSLRLPLAALALALLACVFALSGAAAPPKVGDTFPKLEKYELEGNLPETIGKVVLIDFWASWCGPCQKAFPVLKELHQLYAERGFLVLGVSVDERKAAMQAFLAKTPAGFPTVRDAKEKLSKAVDLEAIPTSYLVGRNGKVIAIHQGFENETTKKQLTQEIEAALQGQQP
ncbi:MAG: TlpA family protein disulfide reductase [Limisphaerales bacterium]